MSTQNVKPDPGALERQHMRQLALEHGEDDRTVGRGGRDRPGGGHIVDTRSAGRAERENTCR